jgi:hypothetical protein
MIDTAGADLSVWEVVEFMRFINPPGATLAKKRLAQLLMGRMSGRQPL